MLIYKAICDSCGREFDPYQTFTVEVQETTTPNVDHYMLCNAMTQARIVPKREYIVCKECLNKFPFSII